MGVHLLGKEGGRGVLKEEARVARISSNIVLRYIPGGGWEMERGGSMGKGWTAGGTGRLGSLFSKLLSLETHQTEMIFVFQPLDIKISMNTFSLSLIHI